MSATTDVHPARAEMDRWRVTTPRPILISVRTERAYTEQGFVFRARYGLNTYAGIVNLTLTNEENHLHAAMEVLPERGTWRLVSPNIALNGHFEVSHGDFIFERVEGA